MRIQSMLALSSYLLNCGLNPSRRRFGVSQHLGTQRFGLPSTYLRNHIRGNLRLAQRLERLNNQGTLLQPNPGFLYRVGP